MAFSFLRGNRRPIFTSALGYGVLALGVAGVSAKPPATPTPTPSPTATPFPPPTPAPTMPDVRWRAEARVTRFSTSEGKRTIEATLTTDLLVGGAPFFPKGTVLRSDLAADASANVPFDGSPTRWVESAPASAPVKAGKPAKARPATVNAVIAVCRVNGKERASAAAAKVGNTFELVATAFSAVPQPAASPTATPVTLPAGPPPPGTAAAVAGVSPSK